VRQVPEIFLNKSSKHIENALIEWLRKETTRYFWKLKYTYLVSLESFYHLWFVSNLCNKKCLETSKLDLKVILYSPIIWKDFLEFKNIILEEKLSTNWKIVMKIVQGQGYHSFETSCLDVLVHEIQRFTEKPYVKFFITGRFCVCKNYLRKACIYRYWIFLAK
jgi:hypothetical protein